MLICFVVVICLAVVYRLLVDDAIPVTAGLPIVVYQ